MKKAMLTALALLTLTLLFSACVPPPPKATLPAPEPQCDAQEVAKAKTLVDSTVKEVDVLKAQAQRGIISKENEKLRLENWLPGAEERLGQWPALSAENAAVPRLVALDEVAKKELRNQVADTKKAIEQLTLDLEKLRANVAEAEKKALRVIAMYSKLLDCQVGKVNADLAKIKQEMEQLRAENTKILGASPR